MKAIRFGYWRIWKIASKLLICVSVEFERGGKGKAF